MLDRKRILNRVKWQAKTANYLKLLLLLALIMLIVVYVYDLYQQNEIQKDVTKNKELVSATWYMKSTNTVLQRKAFNIYMNVADQGDSRAYVVLGNMYQNGIGIDKDDDNALKYYQKSITAGKNINIARYSVATIYLQNKEYNKAVPILEELTKDNYKNASIDLAILYLNGLGIDKNVAKAKEILVEASNKNSLDAKVLLGDIYYKNLDYTDAKKMWQEASDKNDSDAQLRLGMLYMLGAGKDEKYKNKQKGMICLDEASGNGNARAKFVLGEIYYYGKFDIEPNKNKGEKLIKSAAQNGDPIARNMLKQINLK